MKCVYKFDRLWLAMNMWLLISIIPTSMNKLLDKKLGYSENTES